MQILKMLRPGRNAGVGVSESGMSLGRKEPGRCINTLFDWPHWKTKRFIPSWDFIHEGVFRDSVYPKLTNLYGNLSNEIAHIHIYSNHHTIWPYYIYIYIRYVCYKFTGTHFKHVLPLVKFLWKCENSPDSPTKLRPGPPPDGCKVGARSHGSSL